MVVNRHGGLGSRVGHETPTLPLAVDGGVAGGDGTLEASREQRHDGVSENATEPGGNVRFEGGRGRMFEAAFGRQRMGTPGAGMELDPESSGRR